MRPLWRSTFFTTLKSYWEFIVIPFSFSPIFNDTGINLPPNLLAILCVFNTLLPSVFIKAIYKIYASLPKIQSSSTNYSQYMNFRHEESTTSHCQSATLTLKNISFKFYLHLAKAYTSSLLGYIWHRWRHGNKKHGGEQTWCATTVLMLLYLHLSSCKPRQKTHLDKCITPCLKQ